MLNLLGILSLIQVQRNDDRPTYDAEKSCLNRPRNPCHGMNSSHLKVLIVNPAAAMLSLPSPHRGPFVCSVRGESCQNIPPHLIFICCHQRKSLHSILSTPKQYEYLFHYIKTLIKCLITFNDYN